jgi:hypothetical protein
MSSCHVEDADLDLSSPHLIEEEELTSMEIEEEESRSSSSFILL